MSECSGCVSSKMTKPLKAVHTPCQCAHAASRRRLGRVSLRRCQHSFILAAQPQLQTAHAALRSFQHRNDSTGAACHSHRRAADRDAMDNHAQRIASARQWPPVSSDAAVGLVTVAAVTALLMQGGPADAAGLLVREEPSNALSLPTWAIHVSSVIEWIAAMGLVWRYAEVTGRPAWKGLTWGMVPLLGGAFSACVYHLFYNSPQLDALVALQAALTFIGNGTCAWAAYRIYRAAQDGSSARQ